MKFSFVSTFDNPNLGWIAPLWDQREYAAVGRYLFDPISRDAAEEIIIFLNQQQAEIESLRAALAQQIKFRKLGY